MPVSDHPAFTVRALEPIFLEESLPDRTTTPFATTVSSFVTLLIRADDTDGGVGWGEAWCNFPRFGGQYRARIVADLIAPMVINQTITGVAQTFADLEQRLAIAAIQSGDRGAFAQALAGVDIALWDLAARRAEQPLWRLLGGESAEIGTYASLGAAKTAIGAVDLALDRGFQHFKVRAYEDVSDHLDALSAIRRSIGDAAGLAVDANQSWSLDRAGDMVRQLSGFHLDWVEEPLPATAPQSKWAQLADRAPMPLAAGENLYGHEAFKPYIASGSIKICQPDATKWGGISGVLPLAREIRAARRRYSPHFFSGAVGLLASAHLLAAAGGDGLLEVGSHPYPPSLRDELVPLPEVRDGRWRLSDQPGLGVKPSEEIIGRFRRMP